MVFIGAPVGFLVCASFLRAMVEFYLVIFRIAENVDQLAGITDTVDKLSGLSDAAERIPFLNLIRRATKDKPVSTQQQDDQNNTEE